MRGAFGCRDDLDTDPRVLTVIAPCFNEQDNIDLLVKRALATFDDMATSAEMVLVDDASTDETWTRIHEQTLRDDRIRGVRHDSNQGIVAAWHTGVAAARGKLICTIDADLQNRPEDIARLYKCYLRELPDVIQAVRHPGPGVTRCRLFSRGLNFLLNRAFGMRLRDNKSGFVLCRREVLTDILRHRYRYRYFQSFIGVSAHARGYQVADVHTDFDQRHGGTSFLNRFPIGVSLRIFWELLKFRVETLADAQAAGSRTGWPVAPGLAKSAGE